jgi:ubiquinone/menaquinone biosynthesis C-methylase UbiE
MNYGYYEEGFHPQLNSTDEKERYPIQLYHHVASQINLEGKMVLEVGSGRGGGASYIAQNLNPVHMMGIDISETAVDFCNNNYQNQNLKFLVGDSEQIPFDAEAFDVVINVESSHCYGSMEQFLAEVIRVLKPGGYFLFCDLRETSALDELLNLFNHSNLNLIQHQDITKNIIIALTEMSPKRQKSIEKSVPKFLNKTFKSYAGVEGSSIHESFKNGTLSYLSGCLQK